jgi:hypothetical protein
MVSAEASAYTRGVHCCRTAKGQPQTGAEEMSLARQFLGADEAGATEAYGSAGSRRSLNPGR